MNIKHKISIISRLGIGFAALAFMLAGCSGSSSSSDAAANNSGAVTGVATPSKVSVVNTN